MSIDPKKTRPLPETSGEFSDEVTKTNEEMKREFEKGDEANTPRADRPGGVRGSPD